MRAESKHTLGPSTRYPLQHPLKRAQCYLIAGPPPMRRQPFFVPPKAPKTYYLLCLKKCLKKRVEELKTVCMKRRMSDLERAGIDVCNNENSRRSSLCDTTCNE